MDSQPNAARYARLRGTFETLLRELSAVLSKAELDEIRHFVDLDEFALALETACDLLREENYAITPALGGKLRELAQPMELSDDVCGGLPEATDDHAE